jgi:hypothetical protein
LRWSTAVPATAGATALADPAATLASLGVDSLRLVRLIAELETVRYRCPYDDAEVRNFATLSSVRWYSGPDAPQPAGVRRRPPPSGRA